MSDEHTKPSQSGIPAGGMHKEQRKVHRFRVNWHVDILFPDQSVHQGFINDISVQGASVFLSDNLNAEEATLHIHIPPLSLTSAPHIVAISGKTVYMVFDSDKQQYRLAFVFQKFHQSSDQAYLEERLSKYQMEIHEPESQHHIVEL